MHDIKADIAKNRLYFKLGAITSNEEIEAIIITTKQAVDKLKPGFNCISDLREYSIPGTLSEHFMKDCQEILWETSIGKVVRISHSKEKALPFRFESGSLVWPGYEVTVVATPEAAEAILAADEASATSKTD